MFNQNHHYKPNKQDDISCQLERYQQKIANILESFTDGFFEVDCNWTVTYWNAEAERLLMKSREEILGKNLWDVYKDAVPLKFFTEYHRAVNDHVAVRFEEYFEPMKIWVEVAAFPSGEGLSVYFKDITEAKRIESVLNQERKKYQDLFDFSPLPQWVYDVDTLSFLQVNQAAINQYGFTHGEFLNMTIEAIHPRAGLRLPQEIIDLKVKTGKNNQSIVQHKKKNGEIIFVQIEGNSVSFGNNNARLVLAIDLTEKMEAERELQHSLNRYDIVSKATSDAIWDWDIQRGIISWNKGIRAIFGHQNVDLTYDWWQKHVHPDDVGQVTAQFNKLLSNQEPRHQIEYRFRCADGTYKDVLDRSFIMFDEHGKAVRVIGSMQDISARIHDLQAIEAQNIRLREISWMQTHAVRAPLAKILGLTELMNLESATPVNEILELAKMAHICAIELDQVVKAILEKSK